MNDEHREPQCRLTPKLAPGDRSPLDWRVLARDAVLAAAEDAVRWDPQLFIEAAHDLLLAPEDWWRYAAEIEGREPSASPHSLDLVTKRVAESGLADLGSDDLVMALSSAQAFRAVTHALQQRTAAYERARVRCRSPVAVEAVDLDRAEREVLLLLLEGRSVQEIAVETRLDLRDVLDSLAHAHRLLARAMGAEAPRRRHLDFSVVELARFAGHPGFWQRWSRHIGECARCRELFCAALALRLDLDAIEARHMAGAEDEAEQLHVGCLAVWCLSAESLEETVWRCLSIGEAALREECLRSIIGALLRSHGTFSAQQRLSAFVRRHHACSGRAERDWMAVIGRFKPCHALDPAAWDRSLAARLPAWFGQALVGSLHLHCNAHWESKVQNWPFDQPWQSAGFEETYSAYIGWLAAFRGE